MGKENLHNYLMENKQNMIEDWLAHDTFEGDSIYSDHAFQSTRETFSKQYLDLIQGLADFLLQPEDHSHQHLINWAMKVAQERAQTGTTIVEWMTHFQSFCEIVRKNVNAYIENTPSISKHTTLLWTDLFSSMFDTITKEFIKEYLDITESQLKAQRNIINQLSSPVIPIANEIGVLPIIGEMDDNRAQSILTYTLTQCVDQKIAHLCMDLSGVQTMDTMVAHQIFKIIKSLKLIGVKTTLSGMSPEVAQTAVHLGVDFENIPVASSLQKALYNIGFKFEA